MNKNIILTIIAAAILFSQCSDKQNTSVENEIAIDAVNSITLSADQIKQLGIKTQAVKTDTISTTITLTGNLICPTSSQTMINYPISVQVEKLWVQPGQIVRAGQIIASVSDLAVVQMQDDYWNTKSELQCAESEWNRQQKLKQENATSEKSWLESKVKWEQTQSKLNAQTERLKLIGITPGSRMEIQSTVNIKAPNSGQLTELNIAQGQRIQPGESICRIMNLDRLWAEISLFDNQKAQSILGNNAEVEDAAHNKASGKIIQVDGQVSPVDHAIHAWIEIQNPNKNWKPGQAITAHVAAESIKAIQIPKSAVVNFENKDYVFQVKNANNFTLIEIQKVHEEGDIIWVNAQLSDSPIITEGSYYALQAMKNQGE